MLKQIILVLTCIVILSSSKCNKETLIYARYPLYFNNKSSQVVINLIGFKSIVTPYPDTSFNSKTIPFFINNGGVNPNEKVLVYDGAVPWKEILYELPNDSISFYVFHIDTLNTYPWDTIRARYLILQRYDLSLKDLENRNFEIEYPYDPNRGKLKVWKP